MFTDGPLDFPFQTRLNKTSINSNLIKITYFHLFNGSTEDLKILKIEYVHNKFVHN